MQEAAERDDEILRRFEDMSLVVFTVLLEPFPAVVPVDPLQEAQGVWRESPELV